jgi:DNA primase catalytic core
MSRDHEYEIIRNKLKEKLIEFLDSHPDVSKSKHNENTYKCIYPDHADKTPSLKILNLESGIQIGHCFGCSRNLDIFTANHLLNGAPMMGYEFITQNVKPLAEQFDIEYTPRPMTDEEIEEMNNRNIIHMAKHIIISSFENDIIHPKVLEYINNEKSFGDNIKNLLQFGVGTVKSWESFISEMDSRGVNYKQLEKAGIEPTLFNEHALVFTVSDEYGVPRGFASRNCIFDKDNPSSAKYYNSRSSYLYSKRNILYNLHRAIKKTNAIKNSIYVVEGYTDAIALDLLNLKAVALGGTALTIEHVNLLQKMQINDIVLLLDGDEAGKNNAAKAITKTMEGIRNFRVRIMILPDEHDPDSFIKVYGIKKLLELPHITPFEWRLQELKAKTDLDGYEIAKNAISLIINEESPILQDKMAFQLSEAVDVPIHIIRREITLLTNSKQQKVAEERDAILDSTNKLLKRSPSDAIMIFEQAVQTIRHLDQSHNEYLYDEQECYDFISNAAIAPEVEPERFKFGLWKMPRLMESFEGSMRKKLLFLGGQPNAGKSSFFHNIMINMLEASKEAYAYDKAHDPSQEFKSCILLHSIDDSRDDVIPRLTSILAWEKFRKATINLMANPFRYSGSDQKLFQTIRNETYQKVLHWVKNGNLVIKDSSHGETISVASVMIKTLQDKFPDNYVYYFLDNFHDLGDLAHITEERVRVGRLCRMLRALANKEDCTIFSTVEYRKGTTDSKNTGYTVLNEMIKESKTLEYDANWIGHLMNDLHFNPDNTEMYWTEKTYPNGLVPQDKKLPIVSLICSKNKITSFKGDIHYFFHPAKALFLEVHRNNFKLLRPAVREKLARVYGWSPDDFDLPINNGTATENNTDDFFRDV